MCILRSQQGGLLSRHKINMMLSALPRRCRFCLCAQQETDVTQNVGISQTALQASLLFSESANAQSQSCPHWTQWTLFPVKLRPNYMYKAFHLLLVLNKQVRSADLISRTEGPRVPGPVLQVSSWKGPGQLHRVWLTCNSLEDHKDSTHLAESIKKGQQQNLLF